MTKAGYANLEGNDESLFSWKGADVVTVRCSVEKRLVFVAVYLSADARDACTVVEQITKAIE